MTPRKRRNIVQPLSVQYGVMLGLRYRWILPVGHTLIDLLLLVCWIWHATVTLKQQKGHCSPAQVVSTVAFLQDIPMTFDLSTIPPPPAFVLLVSGTLPAGIVSTYLRPDAGSQTRRKLWDPTWLLIHEAVAIPFWFLMGMWIDTGRSRMGKLMWFFLLTRGAFGLLDAALGAAQFGILAQGLFWLGLSGYGIVQGVRRLARMVKGPLPEG